MRKYTRLIGAAATLTCLGGLMLAAAPAYGAATQTKPPSAQSRSRGATTVVTAHGTVTAEIVPMPKHMMRRHSAYVWDGNVEMSIDGDGWYANSWTIQGNGIPPGECVYSTYWVPRTTVSFHGPNKCNTTNSVGRYQSVASGVTFSGNGYVAGTVLHLAGKPQIYVQK